jgi:hypothetical protein
VETDPHGMCELLVGLPEMTMLGITEVVGGLLRVHVQTPRPSARLPELRDARPGEGAPGRGAGGPAGLRAAHPPHLAQAPAALWDLDCPERTAKRLRGTVSGKA